MQTLVALACGSSYAVDWNAMSAIATTAAILVALWIPSRDRRLRRLEKFEAEARAAQIVAQKLGAIIEIFPDIVELIAKSDGELIDGPGAGVIYGVDACRGLIEREAFCHQLPSNYIGQGELVCSLARDWCADIDVRHRTQRDPKLKESINWRKHDFVRSLGNLLHSEAVSLCAACRLTRAQYEQAKLPLHRRALAIIYRPAA